MVDDADSLEEACRAAVAALMAQHKWQLLEPTLFAQRTLGFLRDGTATTPQRAAVHTYSLALYQACSGAEGKARQDRGFVEMRRLLFDRAYWKYRDVCEDATNRALERLYETWQQCRQPGAFLAFAFQHLRDAARATRRQAGPPMDSLDATGDPEAEARIARLPDPAQRDPAEGVIRDEQRRRIVQLKQAFLQRHPRAGQQLEALLLRHLEALDDAAIAARLGTSVANVPVLRSRALQKLRQEPAWRAFAIELGIVDGRAQE